MIRRRLDEAEGKPNRLLLYIDQWEELYAQAASGSVKEWVDRPAADIDRFIDLLLTAAGIARFVMCQCSSARQIRGLPALHKIGSPRLTPRR
jgi:hypothetical protein